MTTGIVGSRRASPDAIQAPVEPSQQDAAEIDPDTLNNPAQPRADKPPATNLVLPRSPLIGRDHEIAAIQRLLLQERVALLTLTGAGGIGKTRLAMQVATTLLDHFVDGVYFVSLAPIREAEPALVTIAETLGVREASGQPLLEALQSYLRNRQMLLVLDNFEQLLVAAPLLASLLAQCHRLKLLVTSRATLHLYSEQEFPVPPLALPESIRLAAPAPQLVSALEQVAAVAVFVERARISIPDFALTENNAAAVAEICVRLDGLPLAIELAAARLKLFSPPALLARMQQRLPLLTGGPHDVPARQRTLRAEIGWSYDLLEAGEQALFRRLAVFSGGFTPEAAQAVGNVSSDLSGHLASDLLEGIAILVDQNLLQPVPGIKNEARFGMLETIREYGLEQLTTSDEMVAVRRAHAGYYLKLVEEGIRQVRKGQHGDWATRLACEQGNWLMALAWCQSTGNIEQELRMAAALWGFWLNRGYLSEDRRYLEALLERAEEVESGPVLASVLEGAGAMAWLLDDNPAARLRLEKSLALARALHDKRLIAEVLIYLGWVILYTGDDLLAAAHFEEGLALAREIGDKIALAEVLTALGDLTRERGDYRQAAAFFEESLALFQEVGASIDVAFAHIVLGQALRLQGDRVRARMHFKASLAQHRDLGISRGLRVAACLQELAQLYVLEVELTQAASLCGAAEALEEIIGASPSERVADLHKQLGTEEFAVAWAAGRLMSPEQAIDYALALPDHFVADPTAPERATTAPSSPAYPAGLTAREVEVLRLLAQGLTYSQIAERLIVSRRTVNTHMISIYSKLNVHSRFEATRFALDHHLI